MAQAKRKQVRIDRFEIDPWLLGSAVAIATLGIVMVASASVAIAEKSELPVYYFALKHLVALGLGIGLAWLATRIPLDNLEKAGPLLLPVAIVALLLVFLPGLGHTVNGATRWVNLGFMQFQMVEAVKILFILFLAAHLVRHQEQVTTSFRGVLIPCAIAGFIAALLLGQPDFGGAVLILATAGTLLWLVGARFRDLASLGLMTVPVMVWLALSESYRLRRLRSFLDPWADPFNEGFQLAQALIAVGRGELFGVGLGGSVQKLFYLPEAHTDFILAVLAEELGFVGIVLVLAAYGVLVGRGMLIGMRATEMGRPFVGLVAWGLSALLGMQAVISIGVNLGVLPTKGLTLPLISSGGSSVMMSALTIGLLLRCAAETAAEGKALDAQVAT
ncbi:MAG: putative lipid II flippase FtsW [Pseudomonadota bacterium]